MATSVEEAIAEAIADIKSKEWCVDAEQDTSYSEDKPFNYVRKRLLVFHQTKTGGYTYGGRELYISKDDFSWYWQQGGAVVEPTATPFRDLVESKLPTVKTNMSLDWIEIDTINEANESGIVIAVKTDTGDNAFTYTIKVWKEDATTIGYKIIGKTSVT